MTSVNEFGHNLFPLQSNPVVNQHEQATTGSSGNDACGSVHAATGDSEQAARAHAHPMMTRLRNNIQQPKRHTDVILAPSRQILDPGEYSTQRIVDTQHTL